jgi:hypothetical protein
VALFRQALDVFERTLGAAHPHTEIFREAL